jgi:integrase
MTAIRLTKRAVDTLAPSSKTVIHFDKDLAGFGLRITPSGARSWIVQYRPGGGGRGQTARRMTLGSISTLTPDEARRAARDVLARARLGEDPAGTRAKDRETPTFKTFAERYLAEEAAAKLKPRTVTNYRIYLLKHAAPDLGGLKLTAITSAEVGKLHRRIGKAKPIVANRVVEAVASVYRYAAAEHLVPKGYNPAAGIEAFREINRERYLSTPELERLGVTLRLAETEGLPWTVDEASPKAKHVPKSGRRTLVSASACAAIRLLLFTGCRLREILHTRWEDIDFERGLLLLPDSKTGRRHVVLNAPALLALNSLPRVGAYVIPGESAGTKAEKPRADLKRPWAVISQYADLQKVRLHDLRHSFASVGAGAGLGLPIVGKLLGHAAPSTTSRYAHLDADPLRRASNAIGGQIAAAMGDGNTRSSEVVPLRRTDTV